MACKLCVRRYITTELVHTYIFSWEITYLFYFLSSEFDDNRKQSKAFQSKSGLSGPINILFNGELMTSEEITPDDFEQVKTDL